MSKMKVLVLQENVTFPYHHLLILEGSHLVSIPFQT